MFASWDFEKFLALLSRQRHALIVANIAGLLVGLVMMHVIAPSYTVSIQLVPAPNSPQANPGGGSLAAITGGLLGGGDSATPFKIYVAGLQSHAVSEMIARDQNLMHRMYATQWSQTDHAWKRPAGLLRPVTGAIKAVLGITSTPWQPPSADDVYVFLQDDLNVIESRDNPVVTVSMQSRDPRLAADFLRTLTTDVDLFVRERALNRANEYISFISQELNHVTVAEYRTALIGHLSDQEKSRIMASANKVGFSADVFSGPMISQKPTAPKLIPTVVTTLVFANLLGILMGFLYDRRGRIFTVSGFAGLSRKHREEGFLR